jgi:hypothetical protein
MTQLEINKQKAKQLLSSEKFLKIEQHIESFPISNSKKASIWRDFLNGQIILGMFIQPEDITETQLSKIDEDIKERGVQAILDILSNHKMLSKNLSQLLRKKYNSELLEAKQIIHKQKFYS